MVHQHFGEPLPVPLLQPIALAALALEDDHLLVPPVTEHLGGHRGAAHQRGTHGDLGADGGQQDPVEGDRLPRLSDQGWHADPVAGLDPELFSARLEYRVHIPVSVREVDLEPESFAAPGGEVKAWGTHATWFTLRKSIPIVGTVVCTKIGLNSWSVANNMGEAFTRARKGQKDLMKLPAQQAQAIRLFSSASVVALALLEEFHQSEADFYMAIGCIYYGDLEGGFEQPFAGAAGQMTGLSYPQLMDDKLDPEKPEALIYEQGENGEFLLAAAVWMVQAGPDTERPELFGQEFEGPVKAEKATPLQHVNLVMYDLHAWLWKENPAGLFARTNPSLHCVFDSYEIRAQPAPFPVTDPRTLP